MAVYGSDGRRSNNSMVRPVEDGVVALIAISRGVGDDGARYEEGTEVSHTITPLRGYIPKYGVFILSFHCRKGFRRSGAKSDVGAKEARLEAPRPLEGSSRHR